MKNHGGGKGKKGNGDFRRRSGRCNKQGVNAYRGKMIDG